jgi:hypothetical protein
MSTWADRFGLALTHFKDAWGAAFDYSSSPLDDDDSTFVDVVNRISRVVGGVGGGIGESIAGAAGGAIEGASWAGENLVAEPISTMFTAGSLAESETWRRRIGADNSFSAIFSGDTWAKAHGIAQERSAGRSLAGMFITKDILAEGKEFDRFAEDSILFNAVTGTLDAGLSLFYDPIGAVGKAASGAKAVREGFNVGHRRIDEGWTKFWAEMGVGPGRQSADELADSAAVDKFLDWTEGKTGRQIANHEAVKRSAYPSVMAGLLQEADRDTKRLIIAAGYGSKDAFNKLASRRDDLAFRVARADNVLNTAVEFEIARAGEFKVFVPKLAPAEKKGLSQPEPEQLPLFDFGQFPMGKEGKAEKVPSGATSDPKISSPAPFSGGPTGPAGKGYDYPSISGNIPESIRGRVLVGPKSGPDGTYMMEGPINADAVKELLPYFKGDVKKREYQKYVQGEIPGLPPEENWRVAGSWEQHDETLAGLSKGFSEESSMRVKSWPEQHQKWFLQYQQEILKKSEKEMELLIAAVGPGGTSPGRGIWASMQDYAIRSDKDLAKADRALAYDWDSKSIADEVVIHPKAFGTPVRVIKDLPFGIMRSFTEKRAPSWLDPNRGDSHSGFAAFLNQIKVFSPGSKSTYLRQYMAAFTPEAKRAVVEGAEAKAIEFMAEKYGISKEAADAIIEKTMSSRNRTISELRKPRQNVYGVGVVDEDLIPVTSTLFETQVVNGYPLLDLEKIDRAFRANKDLLLAADAIKTSKMDFLDRTHDVFQQIWSFSVLMRFGYTIRTLTDDMLRAMASLGAMSIMGGINAGLKSAFTTSGTSWRDATLTGGAAGQRARNIKARTAMGLKKTGARLAAKAWAGHDVPALREILAEITDKHGRDIGTVRKQTGLGFEYRGRGFSGAYEREGDVYEKIVGGSYEAIARTTKELTETLRREYAAWDVKNPGDPDHLSSWVDAANQQIAKSRLGKLILQSASSDRLVEWMKRTPEGRAVRKSLGNRDPEQLVGQAQAVIDAYLPVLRSHKNPMILRELALKGELDEKTLEDLFPNVAERPQVHGPTIDHNLFQGGPRKWMDSIISDGFRWLSQIPTDRLIRHPTFNMMYQHHVKVAYDNLAIGSGITRITGADLAAIEHVAREKALRQINGLLYNLGEKSNAAHAMRFVAGFFSAWEDSIKKWANLAVDKPQLLFYGAKVWEAPNQMNLGSTEDEHGNRVPRVAVYDDEGRQIVRKNVNGRQVYLIRGADGEFVKNSKGEYAEFDSRLNDKTKFVARLPEWVKGMIPGAENFGQLEIPKESLNLILQGDPWWLPGAGPLTQIPASALQARNPTNFESLYKWAIPHGPQSVADVMLPGWLKQAIKTQVGIKDPAYSKMWLEISQTEEMRIRQGLRERPKSKADFRREIDDRTNTAFKIRSFTRFFAPFTADLKSPYQMYIDAYHQMREVYGEEADERFYERYGEDLYLFSTAISKNNVGANATKEAYKAVEKFKDLIAENPEYGGLIIGPDVQKGKFNQYVYSAQFDQTLGSGSTLTVRERRSPEEALKANRVKLGWVKFQRYMALLNSAQFEQGIDEKVVARARGVLAEKLANENADWGKDYYEQDLKAIPHRIQFFTELVQNKDLLSNPLRTDLRVLNEYLKMRKVFVDHLSSLKAADRPHTLDAKENERVADLWEMQKKRFVESDTRFEELYNRYLINDSLQV